MTAPARTGRRPLPRFVGDVVVTVNLAAADLDEAHRRGLELEAVIRRAVTAAVRNYGSRTARVIAVTADPGGNGPDAWAEQ